MIPEAPLPVIPELLAGYRRGAFTPEEIVEVLRQRAQRYEAHNIFTQQLDMQTIRPWLHRLARHSPRDLPLYGVPFLIKDNIDLAGVVTTAGCRAFSYTPCASATVVQRLLDAGAIPLGKTNMDQFATGLVGTRSPDWGPCGNAFDPTWISGGSSSGSAVGVALGLASFALGTDTAGSGRVPAMLNNLYGHKPSRGLLSMTGVVPACRSLDCPSIFALTAQDARTVFDVSTAFDKADPWSRHNPFANSHRCAGLPVGTIRIAVPLQAQRDFLGDSANAHCFETTLEEWRALGAELVEVDITPLLDAAKMLYQGPWVAERYAAVSGFMEHHAGEMDTTVRGIIEAADGYSAVDQWRAEYQMQRYRADAAALLAPVDFLLVPTAATTYPIENALAEPLALNANMGLYTNFMNLLDLCGTAVPADFNSAGRPFGVTLVAPAFHDQALLGYAALWQSRRQDPLGATGIGRSLSAPEFAPRGDQLEIVVCGAHLEGMPLNWQLRERGGKLSEKTRTAAAYRLYALAGGTPPRPGMIRSDQGAAIDVEVWSLPSAEFGGFVAAVPAPLCIGKVELECGRQTSGFLCEAWGLAGADDITPLGSWRTYLRTLTQPN